MARSTHHHDYQLLIRLLRDLRKNVGISQVALGVRLGNTQTFISKVERGERRVDVVEFTEICEALGVDALQAFQAFQSHRRAEAPSTRKIPRRDQRLA